MKRLLILCLLASLAVPAAASAVLPRPDGPAIAVRHENAPFTPPAPSPATATRTVTIDSGGGSTLAIVLASAALGVALCGSAYVAVRLRPLQRSS